MIQCMDTDNIHRRMAKIMGQLKAIDRMVDEDVPCEDVLSQINAAKSALNKVGQIVLEGHIHHCVRDAIAGLGGAITDQEKMTPELGFRLMGDTSAILAETYDKIGAQLPQDQRAEVSEMQMIDFIDPAVAEPLVKVQDKLEGFSMRAPGEEGR